ncbi:MAG: DUF6705 family protein [Janthinobacterium lividum]
MRSLLKFCLCGLVAVNISAMPAHKLSTLPKQIDTMLGTWEWHTNSETFRVVLQREPAFKLPDGSIHDVIIGTHNYRSEFSNAENSIGVRGVYGNPGFTLFGFPTTGEKLLLSFHDITKNKQGNVLLQAVPGKPNELRWQLTPPTETVSLNKPTPAGYTVPTTLLLTRVR